MSSPSKEEKLQPEGGLIDESIWCSRLGTALLGSVWLMVIFQLSLVWRINAQYTHGWLVPLMCIYFASKTSFASKKKTARPHSGFPYALWSIGGTSILMIFPVWIIREANSDWRLINVTFVGLTMLMTFTMFHYQGGWPKVRALAFAVLFFLVAVPWPLATDLQLTLWLQGKVSRIIVDSLLLLGYHAELEGHVIHVPPFGKVGVDEACSGIRGLQASLVASLFIGHFYQFTVFSRTLFCFIGFSFSLLANVARAFILASFAARGEISLVEEWHDAAGLLETGFILLGLLICTQLIKGGGAHHSLSEKEFKLSSLKTSLPIPFSIMGLSIVIFTLSFSSFHYYMNERHMTSIPPLDVDFSGGDTLVEELRPSQQIEAQLHYESAISTKWQDIRFARKTSAGTLALNPHGEYWQGFACSWKSGGACMAVLSTHSPDACLPLSGLRKINPPLGQMPEITIISIGGYEVPFEGYEFEKEGNRLFVFRCFWPSKIHGNQFPGFPQGGYNFRSRIKSAWDADRNVGGTMIALCVGNVLDLETAKRKLANQVQQRLKPKS